MKNKFWSSAETMGRKGKNVMLAGKQNQLGKKKDRENELLTSSWSAQGGEKGKRKNGCMGTP